MNDIVNNIFIQGTTNNQPLNNCDSTDRLEFHRQLCVCKYGSLYWVLNTYRPALQLFTMTCLLTLLQQFPGGRLVCGTSSVSPSCDQRSTSSDLPVIASRIKKLCIQYMQERRLDGISDEKQRKVADGLSRKRPSMVRAVRAFTLMIYTTRVFD